jgi:hypothetical protein
MNNIAKTIVSKFALSTAMAGIAPVKATVANNLGRTAQRIESNWRGDLEWSIFQNTGWSGLMEIKLPTTSMQTLEAIFQERGMEAAIEWLNS